MTLTLKELCAPTSRVPAPRTLPVVAKAISPGKAAPAAATSAALPAWLEKRNKQQSHKAGVSLPPLVDSAAFPSLGDGASGGGGAAGAWAAGRAPVLQPEKARLR